MRNDSILGQYSKITYLHNNNFWGGGQTRVDLPCKNEVPRYSSGPDRDPKIQIHINFEGPKRKLKFELDIEIMSFYMSGDCICQQ